METEEKELDEKPVGPDELAEILSLQKQHVYALVRKKQIPFHKFSSLLRFYVSEVREATRKN